MYRALLILFPASLLMVGCAEKASSPPNTTASQSSALTVAPERRKSKKPIPAHVSAYKDKKKIRHQKGKQVREHRRWRQMNQMRLRERLKNSRKQARDRANILGQRIREYREKQHKNR